MARVKSRPRLCEHGSEENPLIDLDWVFGALLLVRLDGDLLPGRREAGNGFRGVEHKLPKPDEVCAVARQAIVDSFSMVAQKQPTMRTPLGNDGCRCCGLRLASLRFDRQPMQE